MTTVGKLALVGVAGAVVLYAVGHRKLGAWRMVAESFETAQPGYTAKVYGVVDTIKVGAKVITDRLAVRQEVK